MSTKVIHIPSRIWGLIVRAGTTVLICVLIGGMIALFSPSVTLTFDAEERLWFWISLCLVGGMGVFIGDMILDLIASNWPSGAKALALSAAGTIAVLIPLFWIYEAEDLPNVETTVLFVWAIVALIVAGLYILRRNLDETEETVDDIETKSDLPSEILAMPKILSRLPLHLRNAELYALSAEDHYVRVHTSKGEEMILMRLSDAISESDTVEGLQTHRSWWVAKAAIDDIESKGRRAEIKLKTGQTAPVSRSALKTLRHMDWL